MPPRAMAPESPVRKSKAGVKKSGRVVGGSHYLDDDGELREVEVFWTDDVEEDQLQKRSRVSQLLLWLRCIHDDGQDEQTKLKRWVYRTLWLSLICDLAVAITALITFIDVTYCCGTPILEMAGSFPWDSFIRILTYVYPALVLTEIIPVVRLNTPLNVVNPLLCFTITLAMFFQTVQAWTMWAIQSVSILSLFISYRLRARYNAVSHGIIKATRERTKSLRDVRPGEDPEVPKRELVEARRAYYQLNKNMMCETTSLRVLAIGCWVNVILSLAVLTLIIVLMQGGGLCIENLNPPNPFDKDQIGRCPMCEGVDAYCEICTEETQQCYIPYGL